MSKDEAAAAAAKAAAVLTNLPTDPLDDDSRAIAERRLAQIVEVLGLDPTSFENAHDALLAANDGSEERVLLAQCRRIADALSSVPDPVLRARLILLFEAFADDKPD